MLQNKELVKEITETCIIQINCHQLKSSEQKTFVRLDHFLLGSDAELSVCPSVHPSVRPSVCPLRRFMVN